MRNPLKGRIKHAVLYELSEVEKKVAGVKNRLVKSLADETFISNKALRAAVVSNTKSVIIYFFTAFIVAIFLHLYRYKQNGDYKTFFYRCSASYWAPI
jgi:hypothetical protein